MPSQNSLNNLIPQGHTLTQEDSVKGGQKSGEARRKKRTLREAANLFNAIKPKDTDIEIVTSELGEVSNEEIDRQVVAIAKLYKMALAGNVKAMKLYLDISDDEDGEKRRLENEKLKAEVEELKRGTADGVGSVSVNIEIKDCKQ